MERSIGLTEIVHGRTEDMSMRVIRESGTIRVIYNSFDLASLITDGQQSLTTSHASEMSRQPGGYQLGPMSWLGRDGLRTFGALCRFPQFGPGVLGGYMLKLSHDVRATRWTQLDFETLGLQPYGRLAGTVQSTVARITGRETAIGVTQLQMESNTEGDLLLDHSRSGLKRRLEAASRLKGIVAKIVDGCMSSDRSLTDVLPPIFGSRIIAQLTAAHNHRITALYDA